MVLQSRRFRVVWAVWTLILGLSLAFFVGTEHVASFSDYLNAFLSPDMPASWCPTFLTLYGVATILTVILGSSRIKKIFLGLSVLAGIVLLPVGIYATYEYTLFSMNDPLPMYVYAQAIHASEILTGLFTIYYVLKKR